MCEGYRIRRRHEQEIAALQACWIVNNAGMRSGRALKPTELIPDDRKALPQAKQRTAEQNQAELQEIISRFEGMKNT